MGCVGSPRKVALFFTSRDSLGQLQLGEEVVDARPGGRPGRPTPAWAQDGRGGGGVTAQGGAGMGRLAEANPAGPPTGMASDRQREGGGDGGGGVRGEGGVAAAAGGMRGPARRGGSPGGIGAGRAGSPGGIGAGRGGFPGGIGAIRAGSPGGIRDRRRNRPVGN
eukprot:scaffold31571_cov83-Isochrysis_galbana.AAC.2